MFDHVRSVAIALVVVLVALTGCSESIEVPIGFFAREHASYEVSTNAGLQDTLVVTLVNGLPGSTVTAEVVNGSSDPLHIPPLGNLSVITWNLASGIRERIEQDGSTIIPLGIEARLPVAYHPLTLGDWVGAGEVAPVGPQHLLLDRGMRSVSIEGEKWQIVAEQDEARWWIHATFECPWGCQPVDDLTGPAVPLRAVHLEGRRGYLLPETATYSASEVNSSVSLRAVAHTGEGRFDPPLRDDAEPERPLRRHCGYGPCEAQHWPFRLSMQAGLDGLEESSEWKEWAPTAAPAPYSLHLGPTTATIANLTEAELETVGWGFLFVNTHTGSVSLFRLISVRVIGQDIWTPPRMTSVIHDVTVVDPALYVPGFPDVVDLQVGAESAAKDFRMQLAKIDSVAIIDHPRADREHRWQYTYRNVSGKEAYVVSADSGQPWCMAAR